MELQFNSIAELLQAKICRCCLKCNQNDIKIDYYYAVLEEEYVEMLKATLNIQLSDQNIEGYSNLICNECILKLKQANTFRQMVLNSEERLLQLLTQIKEKKSDNILMDNIKTEPSLTAEYCDDSFGDDEILANIKLELTQTGAMLESDRNQVRKPKLKKCNMKPDLVPVQKDWSKIAERRGNGPILRENSLKLLANSNLIVFQWNKSRYRCFCCKEPFSDVNLLNKHTNTKHNLKEIEKTIINQQNRLVKVDISNLECKICNQLIDSLNNLRIHLIDTHNIKFESNEDLLVPFKIKEELICQICHEKFNVFRLLNIHMNRHFQKHVCHICGAGFSNLVFLNLHRSRTHRSFKCNQCEMSFVNKVEKKNHEINTHNMKFERKLRFPCPYCADRFYQENFRVLHLVEKHGHKRPEFKCSICSKIFITKSLCNNHLKTVHLKEKCHECDVCHIFFYTKSDVVRHKVTHTGEKNYSCTTCHNHFASKDSLRRHMRRTHGVH